MMEEQPSAEDPSIEALREKLRTALVKRRRVFSWRTQLNERENEIVQEALELAKQQALVSSCSCFVRDVLLKYSRELIEQNSLRKQRLAKPNW